MEPWAIDANGNEVPTSFTWQDGTLTQHVDLTSPDIAYPVVADPAWTYGYKFAVSKTAAQARALLRSCFNCYFPVSGAPRAYPSTGQLLPLKVGPFNFECKFAGNSTDSLGRWIGFKFNARKNHIDGLGSRISFGFETVSGKEYLLVSAYIVNDSIWVKNAFYRSGAIQTWQKCANTIG